MKIHKYMRDLNIGSLRSCEKLVDKGQVSVNGQVAPKGYIMQKADRLQFMQREYIFEADDSKRVYRYFAFHKPVQMLSSHTDDGDGSRTTLFDAPAIKNLPNSQALRYAGRLDYNSRGLMILSDDGQFIQRLTHPSFGFSKTYRVRCRMNLEAEMLAEREKGFSFDGEDYSAFEWRIDKQKTLYITLYEGKKREIRQLFRSMNNEVRDLLRLTVGPFELGGLFEGEVKALNTKTVKTVLERNKDDKMSKQ